MKPSGERGGGGSVRTLEALRRALAAGTIAPLYYLHGEEPRLRDEALAAFGVAIDALTAVELYLDAACARRAHGLLLGGDAGRALVAEADAWMASEHIRAVTPMFNVIVPALAEI